MPIIPESASFFSLLSVLFELVRTFGKVVRIKKGRLKFQTAFPVVISRIRIRFLKSGSR
ncbi:hypothetical protein l11_12370 [Neisseria weaveri LMG 5135]|nr:hypothetical protein l13_18030 [Neisseria weaveri ATCC 51223]EGV37484.1 hypothetical protein l11_12370 [Neisseria weaveri LMG 5135]